MITNELNPKTDCSKFLSYSIEICFIGWTQERQKSKRKKFFSRKAFPPNMSTSTSVGYFRGSQLMVMMVGRETLTTVEQFKSKNFI